MTRNTNPEEIDVEQFANETVLITTSITAVMNSPDIIEGEVSSSGKTISVTKPHTDKTHRLDTATIMAGESEFRDSRSYSLYTKEDFQNQQKANYAPGPQAGSNQVSENNDLPEPTHTLEDDEDDEDESDEQTETEDESSDEDTEEESDEFEWVAEDELEEETDKWDLSQYGRGTELVLDKFAGSWVVVNHKRTRFGDVLALDVVNKQGELLRLKKVDFGGYHFDARPAKCEGGTIREKGGTSIVRNVENIDDVRDFETIGKDEQRLREWIQSEYY